MPNRGNNCWSCTSRGMKSASHGRRNPRISKRSSKRSSINRKNWQRSKKHCPSHWKWRRKRRQRRPRRNRGSLIPSKRSFACSIWRIKQLSHSAIHPSKRRRNHRRWKPTRSRFRRHHQLPPMSSTIRSSSTASITSPIRNEIGARKTIPTSTINDLLNNRTSSRLFPRRPIDVTAEEITPRRSGHISHLSLELDRRKQDPTVRNDTPSIQQFPKHLTFFS